MADRTRQDFIVGHRGPGHPRVDTVNWVAGKLVLAVT
jgi:hypothetical protein